MDVATPAVQEFFDQYARSRSALDLDRIASQYADGQIEIQPLPERQIQKGKEASGGR